MSRQPPSGLPEVSQSVNARVLLAGHATAVGGEQRPVGAEVVDLVDVVAVAEDVLQGAGVVAALAEGFERRLDARIERRFGLFQLLVVPPAKVLPQVGDVHAVDHPAAISQALAHDVVVVAMLVGEDGDVGSGEIDEGSRSVQHRVGHAGVVVGDSPHHRVVMPPGECDLGHAAHPTNSPGLRGHRHVLFICAVGLVRCLHHADREPAPSLPRRGPLDRAPRRGVRHDRSLSAPDEPHP